MSCTVEFHKVDFEAVSIAIITREVFPGIWIAESLGSCTSTPDSLRGLAVGRLMHSGSSEAQALEALRSLIEELGHETIIKLQTNECRSPGYRPPECA